MNPFIWPEEKISFKKGDWIFVPNVAEKIQKGDTEFNAFVIKISEDSYEEITLKMDSLTDDEKEIILKGCLINYYRN